MGVFNLVAFIQIVLESLPVSSSGHLKLFFDMTGCWSCFDAADFKLFYYFLHGPTFIIFALFFARYWFLMFHWRPIIYFFIIESITLIGYFLFSTYFSLVPLTLGFMVTIALLWGTKYLKIKDKKNIWSKKDAIILGCAQIIALIPGISRMGTLIFVGRCLSYSLFESFIIAGVADIPLALGGFLYGWKKIHGGSTYLFFNSSFMVTVLSATILGYLVLFFVSWLVRKNRLWLLSWYMLLPIVLSLCLVM